MEKICGKSHSPAKTSQCQETKKKQALSSRKASSFCQIYKIRNLQFKNIRKNFGFTRPTNSRTISRFPPKSCPDNLIMHYSQYHLGVSLDSILIEGFPSYGTFSLSHTFPNDIVSAINLLSIGFPIKKFT